MSFAPIRLMILFAAIVAFRPDVICAGEPSAGSATAGSANEKAAQTPAEEARAALAEFLAREAREGKVPERLKELHEVLLESVAEAERGEALSKEIEAAKEAVRVARDNLAAWKGIGSKPPHSAGLLDAAREEVAAKQAEFDSAIAKGGLLAAEADRVRRDLETTSATSRRLAEAAERGQDEASRQERATAAQTAAARARLLAIQSGVLRDLAELNRLTIERLAAERDLALKKVRAVGSSVRISGEELKAAIERLQSSMADLDKRRRALRRATGRGSGGDTGEIALELSLLDYRSELAALEIKLWERRAAFLDDRTAGRGNAAAFLEATRSRLAGLNRDFETGSASALSAANAARARLRTAASPAERAALSAEVDAAERRVALYVEALLSLRSAQKLADWFAADLDGGGSAAAVAGNVWRSFFDRIRAVWRTELYAVEDVVTVEGKRVVGYRGITVGKVVIVLTLLAAGYLALRWGTKRFGLVVARRLSLSPEQAAVANRWFLSIGIFFLALYALQAARIPLTAFAFLGGALAIGVGIATQNLIRNFISGLIIFFERPFRINDILDVGGINGRVTAIGLRASVIRHWDGIETLIPNSALLEGNVTNWTHSDELIRDTLRVGVAYGSDPRLVTDLITGCAAGHGLVLREPAPKVYFEEFGESSLVFRLDYWINFSRASRLDVASDLRFMIVKALAAAHIEIAYPQREIRLQVNAPLPVRIEKRPASPIES